MSFNRSTTPSAVPDSEKLSAMMAGIGINIAAHPAVDPNIEDTLYFASLEGLEKNDLRTLSLVTGWLDIHARRLNADRMVRLISQSKSTRLRAYWKAIAKWQAKDKRLARLLKLYRGPVIDLLPSGTDFQINRKGEDPRFRGSSMRVPAGVLRMREGDILAPEDLANRNKIYRFRVLAGSTYRADMLALLETSSGLSIAELARRTYGSFSTAFEAKRDWETLHIPVPRNN